MQSPSREMDEKSPSRFVLQKVAERKLPRQREAELPLFDMASPLYVVTLTKPPLSPHPLSLWVYNRIGLS